MGVNLKQMSIFIQISAVLLKKTVLKETINYHEVYKLLYHVVLEEKTLFN